ncbi:hypothetical protein [Bradyrhizobium sp. 23]|uniref:hypothetical protein n=1 Tax=Bradyrhizobium sp. 23 TaxID=2782667 RepID=UPI001FF94FEC|nr:hypothetical protein [Bradyrhizobium sp. 23]MCK1316611.1 hypothetical protein [Bradyrhizobium sp. 23]
MAAILQDIPSRVLALGYFSARARLWDRRRDLEQMVLIAALPPVFAGMILAGRYQGYVEMASSTLLASALLFACAAPIGIAIGRSYLGG